MIGLERLRERIDEEGLVDLVSELVRRPSHPGIERQETAVAECICRYFEREGIESELVPVVDGRCNVIARLSGKNKGPTLLLTGHTDTVPPYEMPHPFEVALEGGRLYGRGVVDMKGALACMMTAMSAVKRVQIPLSGEILFAGVIGEEGKSEGTVALVKSGLKADAAIVGEASNLEIGLGHRGLEWLEFDFQGKAVHGGKQKEGVNAIEMASRFIERANVELVPKLAERVHPLLGPSSMNYGYIHGGTQPSTVPGRCLLQIDRRWIPGEKYEEVLGEYRKLLEALHEEDPRFSASMAVMEASVMEPGFVHEVLDPDAGHPIVGVAEEVIRLVRGCPPKQTAFPAWTDGGLLSSYARIPTLVIGPGDLESAHSPTEQVEVSQLVSASLIYAGIAVRFCG